MSENSVVLTLNAGSSSIKFSVFEADREQKEVAHGQVSEIGGNAHLSLHSGVEISESPVAAEAHTSALHAILSAVSPLIGHRQVTTIGHRVVHGGSLFERPTGLDDAVLAQLTQFEALAPLHQPHNLAGIRAAQVAFPQALQVACFDTAFHRSHPWVNDAFALPRSYYDKGVRRYGFHGLSYEYVTAQIAAVSPSLNEGNTVIAHLGNGASMCAVRKGQSVASTMGFSALDGLPMGTRCGQLDPGVVLYLMQTEGLDAHAISDLLYKESGLKGLSGLSNDMRELEASDNPHAAEAIDYFVFRCQREIGAMAAALGGIDALVFCGGIGENSRYIRARICERLAWMGIELDHHRNAVNAQIISSELARTTVMVIPTNEELMIARACLTFRDSLFDQRP